MAFGMWIVRAKMWACTGFTWDPGASYFSVFSLDGAVIGILRFVLGKLEVPTHGRCLVVSCASGTQRPPTGQTSILTRAAQVEVAAGAGPGLAWNALGAQPWPPPPQPLPSGAGGREGVKISR